MDVDTTCPVDGCGAAFATKRGLAVHMSRTHGAAAAAIAAALSAARAIPCPFPDCASTFRSRRGLGIHQAMRGHQPPRDMYARGDGPSPVLRVRGPSKRGEVAPPQDATTNLDANATGEYAREDHPAMRALRATRIRPEPPDDGERLGRILAILRGQHEEEEDAPEAMTAAACEGDPGALAQALDSALDAATVAYDKKLLASAVALVNAADVVSDELLEALGLPGESDDDDQAMPMTIPMPSMYQTGDSNAVAVYAVTLWGLVDAIVDAFQTSPADARKMLDQTEDLCDKLLDALGVADPDNV